GAPLGTAGLTILLPVVRLVDCLPREPKAVVPRMILGLEVRQARASRNRHGIEERLAHLRIERKPPEGRAVLVGPRDRGLLAVPLCPCDIGEQERNQRNCPATREP